MDAEDKQIKIIALADEDDAMDVSDDGQGLRRSALPTVDQLGPMRLTDEAGPAGFYSPLKQLDLPSKQLKTVSVPAKDFSEKLKSFLSSFFDAVIEGESVASNKGFLIDEIELSLAIKASGSAGFGFVINASGGIEGGIKIKIKRGKGIDSQ